jgi:hypothetical protein
MIPCKLKMDVGSLPTWSNMEACMGLGQNELGAQWGRARATRLGVQNERVGAHGAPALYPTRAAEADHRHRVPADRQGRGT